MNAHLDEGQLRAAIDGELDSQALAHLEGCPACQARQQTLRAQVQEMAPSLSFLAPRAGDSVPPARTALNHLYDRSLGQKENSMFRKIFASPILRFGVAFVLLIGLVLAFPATRAFADQLLNLFRVQQVAVIPVDFTGMQRLTGDNTFARQVSQLLASSIKLDQKPGAPVQVSDGAQASALAKFNVRLPQGMTPSTIQVQGATSFSFKIDLSRAQALLNEAGRSDLVLPASLDGETISVSIPAGVSAGFGTCPTPQSEANTTGTPGRRFTDCVILAQIPSPTVSAPADLDIARLATIGLEFTGMTADQAAAFASTVDWTSSLVVPIPKNAASYQTVPVDGVNGTLIQRPADDAPQYALVWVKNGIIYAIGGLGSDTTTALQIAASLP